MLPSTSKLWDYRAWVCPSKPRAFRPGSSHRRFVLYDIAGETLGAIIPLALGYAFGATWEDVGDLLTMGSLCVFTLLVTAVLARRLFSLAQRLKASVHAAQQQLQKLDKQAVEIVKAVEDTLPLSQGEG